MFSRIVRLSLCLVFALFDVCFVSLLSIRDMARSHLFPGLVPISFVTSIVSVVEYVLSSCIMVVLHVVGGYIAAKFSDLLCHSFVPVFGASVGPVQVLIKAESGQKQDIARLSLVF